MTYPAWFELMGDPAIARYPTALRVYAKLVHDYQEIFFEPQEIKGSGIALALHSGKDRVNRSLDLLVRCGYAAEHGRAMNNVRRLTLVRIRSTKPE